VAAGPGTTRRQQEIAPNPKVAAWNVMNEGALAEARTPFQYLQDKLRQRFGHDILRQEGYSSMSRAEQEGGHARQLRTGSQEERRRRAGKAPMEPAPSDATFYTQPAHGEETRRTSTTPTVRYPRQATTPSGRSRGMSVMVMENVAAEPEATANTPWGIWTAAK
jgi:hypothetical protein